MAKLLFLFLPYVTGCSFLFVTPPSAPAGSVVERTGNCTTSKVAPVIDTVLGGLEVARTALAAGASESSYANAPISRKADIGFGIAFAALFLSSAGYGFYETSKCVDRREHANSSLDDDSDEDSASSRPSQHPPPGVHTTIRHPGADDPAPDAAEPPAAPDVAPGTEDTKKSRPNKNDSSPALP